jgi:putative hydrolase
MNVAMLESQGALCGLRAPPWCAVSGEIGAPGAGDPAAGAGVGDVMVALVRIVYLLDRSRAPGHKVAAFRRALDVVNGLEPTELRSLAATGRLESLPGIGATTGSVIAEALRGDEPRYLANLEATTRLEPGIGAELLSDLRGDLHTHSTWSDGGWPIVAMAVSARALGRDYLAVTDHSQRLTVAHGLSPERVLEQLGEIEALNALVAPLRLLTGIEVDIMEDGSLDLPDAVLSRLDVVVASVHSKFHLPAPVMTRRLARAVSNEHVDVLGHCTNRIIVGKGRAPSVFDAAAVFETCAEHSTAVEINSRPERLDPPAELLAVASDKGCMFAIDSDAHAPGQLEWPVFGCDKAAEAGIDADRIINTWPVERLLAWTH